MSSSFSSVASLRIILFVFVIVYTGTTHASAFDSSSERTVSPFMLARIEKYLKKINKPAIKTIQSSDGDIIDCVPIHKQPALDHPLLKDHVIQTVAHDQMPVFEGEGGPRSRSARKNLQAWSHVEHCPDGTVPVRRTTVDDVLRAKSLSHFGKKQLKMPFAWSLDGEPKLPNQGHEYAIARSDPNQDQFFGTKATFNVWDPSVEVPSEFSLSQLWVVAGSYKNSDLNTIEVGWQVFPNLYGDSKPRLFVYWTADAYNKTGCYNLACPGFVQTNNQILLGGPIPTVSMYGGDQVELTFTVWKDSASGNWWLGIGPNSAPVGYWPGELYTHLASSADSVQWGGEIVDDKSDGRHTATQMGSGHFAEEGFRKAGYIRNLGLVDSTNTLNPAGTILVRATNSGCYDIQNFTSADWGSYFYFGGPGRNPKCP